MLSASPLSCLPPLKRGRGKQTQSRYLLAEQCLEASPYPFFIAVLYSTVSGSSSEEHLLTSTSHGHQNCQEALEPRAAAEQRHCSELGASSASSFLTEGGEGSGCVSANPSAPQSSKSHPRAAKPTIRQGSQEPAAESPSLEGF